MIKYRIKQLSNHVWSLSEWTDGEWRERSLHDSEPSARAGLRLLVKRVEYLPVRLAEPDYYDQNGEVA